MYNPFYWYERELDQDYLDSIGEAQSTETFIEQQLANEYRSVKNERR